MNDVIFAHNGPYGGMSIPLQRVTSLCRRAQANVPAASSWLRRIPEDGRQTSVLCKGCRGRTLQCTMVLLSLWPCHSGNVFTQRSAVKAIQARNVILVSEVTYYASRGTLDPYHSRAPCNPSLVNLDILPFARWTVPIWCEWIIYKNVHLLFLNNSVKNCQKLTDFNDFWHVKSWENLFDT